MESRKHTIGMFLGASALPPNLLRLVFRVPLSPRIEIGFRVERLGIIRPNLGLFRGHDIEC